MKGSYSLFLATGFVLASIHAAAGDVKVIANPSVKVDSITAAELKDIFLEEKKVLNDGSHVQPVLAKGGEAHELFLKRYLGKSDDALRNYYRTLVFTGTGQMPKALSPDSEIVSYVAQTNGAIGYIDANTPADGVKVLDILQTRMSTTRMLLRRLDPEYPQELRRRGIGGVVRLQLVISAKGSIRQVSVLGGNPILAEAATKAAKQWVYAPASSETTVEVSIPFEALP